MSDMDLAAKCLDFCQVLASQGQTTSLSITIGSSFSFSMNTGVKCLPPDPPSTQQFQQFIQSQTQVCTIIFLNSTF